MTVYLICLLTVFNSITFKGSKLALSLFALDLGAGPVAIGVMVSLYALAPVVLAVPAGRFADRYGTRAPMLAGSAGLIAGALLPWIVPGTAALCASAFTIGVAFIAFQVAAHSFVGSLGAATDRTRNYSTYTLFVAVAGTVGPLLVGLSIDRYGHPATYLYLAAFPLVPIAMLATIRVLGTRGAGQPAVRRSPLELLKSAPLRRVLVVGAIIETGTELYPFFLPLYGTSVGLSASWIGFVMSMFAAATIVIRLLLPRLVRTRGETRVLAASLVLAGATYLVFPFFDRVVMLACLSFVLGLGIGCGYPLSMSLIYDQAPAGRAGEALGLRVTVTKLTQAAVPLVFGSIGSAAGLLAVFWISGAVLIGGSTLAYRSSAP